MAFTMHSWLLDKLGALLDNRVAQGWDTSRMSQRELAKRSGVSLRHVHRIYHGTPASEETWEKLFIVALKR
jgi:hypothetical protein